MTAPRILFVDDDSNILSGYQRTLRRRFSIDTAISGDAGLALIDKKEAYAVIIADMQMPGMNGVEFLKRAMEKTPDSVRLMLTGNADQKTAAEAVNHGHVFSFLSKPCPSDSLEVALDNALRQYQLVRAEKELLEQTLNGAVKVLTDILAIADPQAFGHAQRLRAEVRAVAERFGIERAWELELGAMLSQIGTVAIPPELLNKSRAGVPLDPNETEMLARIPEIGASLLASIPRMETVANIIRFQRKNFDGTGFPNDSIAGPNIPIGARILRVLSDLLTLEWNRKTRAEAFGQLKQTAGAYDPKVLEAVASCFDLYLGIDQTEARQIRFAELRVGDILVSDIVSKDGTLIVAAGAEISPAMMNKLRNFREIVGVREPISVS
jgi:response regulator RpfG family c-di-GMP phosphodiesterase